MRILFISAFYPPYVVGGWEQLVQEINERLKARDHITHVLTSIYGVDSPTSENGVDRVLTPESDLHHYKPHRFLNHGGRLRRNLNQLERIIEAFEPDVVFIHVMWNLSKGVAWLAEQLCPERVVYYVADRWPYEPDPHVTYWRDPAQKPVFKTAKRFLAPIALKMIERQNEAFALRFQDVLCVSQAIKDDLARNAGIDPACMSVIYNGIDMDRFAPAHSLLSRSRNGLSLLYAGSLVPHKGVHTAIEALAILAQKPSLRDVSLTIVGSGHPDYEAYLRSIVAREDLAGVVHFHDRVPREEMPALLQGFDVLVFPSIWEEPLARMTQEAMAAGLVVIGTTTGGSKEILIEGETALTFEPEDAVMLARRIEQLRDIPELKNKLIRNGRDLVMRKFDIRRMVDEIEEYLGQVVQSATASVAG